MEIRVGYNVKQTKVREACVRPFSAQWEAPKGEEITFVISQISLGEKNLADTFGLSPSEIDAWLMDKDKIPYSVWCLLGLCAGYGEFWK